ncbi:SHOCT domain-containing protein [Microbacterium pumilum]|uniref:SHOCT domain-containing protein n=1 Tax=Microbacterium pumilum TaxID=344165 RepID=A0ABP5EGN2_9MICO
MLTGSFWDFLLWIFWFYILFACIWIFITIIFDLFRDHSLNGWGKALWVIFLIVVPFLAALIYLIARGKGMTERELERRGQAQSEANRYIRSVAGTSSPASEIESAKKLLDSGAITQAEYDSLKAKALAG